MGIERPLLIDVPSEWVGEQIVLRRLRDDDAEPFFDAVMDSQEHLRPWLPWVLEYRTREDAIEFIRRQSGHWSLREHYNLGLFARADGSYLGGVGFSMRNRAVPSFEIGYWLRRGAEGHGHMSEAVRLLTAFLFDTLGAQRVMIRCDARNVRSKAVAERLGFTFEGCNRRDDVDPDGVIRDSLTYALISEEFACVRQAWG